MNLRVIFWRVCAVAGAGSALFSQVVYNTVPSQIVGQAILQQSSQTAVAPNLVEGRELNFPQGLAVDLSVSPPILYVADTANNRILAWKNVNGFTNGAPADLVLGQHDKYSVLPKGPGTDLTAGFSSPGALAVDTSGNLYVADTADNRIMRFPQPFNQTSAGFLPDLVIGQKDLSSTSPNQGNQAPSASTICFTQNGNAFLLGMAFDQNGNLFVSDPCNNRVLRFPQKTLQAGGFNPAADLVLGQSAFTTNTGPPSGSNQAGKNFLVEPSGIALDNEGRLYVADADSRVVVFDVPVQSGQNALRIMGVVTVPGAAPVSAQTLANPDDVVVVGDNPYVVDTGNQRILGYPPFSQWPAEADSFSPSANLVIGQADMTSNSANHGAVHPDANSLSTPVAAAWSGAALLVADTKNNRVLSFPQASAGVIATTAAGVLGQTDFPYNAPNLIEGREFYLFSRNANGAENATSGYAVPAPGGSVVIDTNSTPPHMYVSDPGNNRVLGFRDYRKVAPGVKADIVIGQTDFDSNLINSPATTTEKKSGGTIGVPSATGLWNPEGLALDANGSLYVADLGNGRVLRFPVPFAQTGTVTADLVIGQRDFASSISDPNSVTTGQPYGVAITASGQLLVSDIEFNRILLFTHPAGSDFANGQAAAAVIGQTNFTSVVAGTPATNGLSGPRLMAVDGLDNLYVADTGNNRVAIYSNAPSLPTNATPSLSLSNLHNPLGVSVNSVTGEVWVVDTQGNAVLQYPPYVQLIVNPTATSGVAAFEPLAVTFDPFGNPVIADSTNRVGFFYPIMNMKNTANSFLLYAPGMLATLTPYGTTPPLAGFGTATVSAPANAFPVPTTLGDVQVFVNGVAAPLLFVSSTQIPMGTPTGGLIQFQVVQASTGQIYTSGLFNIVAASPGLFMANATTGALAAINAVDNTVNSSANPVKAGDYISLFGTGQGFVPGAPPDGTAPTGPISTPQAPQVYINGPNFLSPGDIEYSGLAPDYVGLWQINAKVPANAPTAQVNVFVTMDGYISVNDPITGNRIKTVIYVKAAQ